MSGPETRLVRRIMMALRGQYPQGYFRKIHGNAFQHAGIPDIIGCIEGFFIGLEVKTESGRLSTIQVLEGSDISVAGGIYAVVHDPEETLSIVENAISNAKGQTLVIGEQLKNDACNHVPAVKRTIKMPPGDN